MINTVEITSIIRSKRNLLTLEVRMRAIKGYDIEHKSSHQLVKEFPVGNTQILQTMKRKSEWSEE